MNDAPLWARTEERIAQMYRARDRGGICGWCGRALNDGEKVYVEWIRVGAIRYHQGGPIRHRSTVLAPVGVECASAELLDQTAGREPDPCGYCARGVFYRGRHALRQRAMCSRQCERDLRAADKRSRRQLEELVISEQRKVAGPLVPAPVTAGYGAHIRQYREARGMSRADLALAVRLLGQFARTDHVGRWEEQGHMPRVEAFGALAIALGVSMETLLYGPEEASRIAVERQAAPR